ncbi:DUF4479 and tRNA-binding domain-containing protein [Facklamia sp. DSM 111018]|uniref:DUF4479 and tRNA-binding domain-containing protein n=1 Tax=Facklamia lactis TaxID=2749967 RepID=A0ABS0LTR6_9LACT|nr:DUF4479 and tRNA-binding domain-containing protein [Facklamia lactis]MBG9980876.1 DUF4479 and tRNA-binding domain-containing protein [Facklamia lactis]MBG9986761.1 DUF4479 and tRNA-binding domain-containing protein [Facklamia lactis]
MRNWLAFYNPEGIGDVLLLTCANADGAHLISESRGPITEIKDKTNGEIVGLNIHRISEYFVPDGNGLVLLTSDQVTQLNQLLEANAFDYVISVDNRTKFVVGLVEECVPHEDSDHLHITKTRISQDEVLQIVCGAANIAQGQKVLVAKPGAVMPSGLIIWPGELRGVQSNGMICSTRELGLEELENYPGIWELTTKAEIGQTLEEVKTLYV